VLGDRTEALVYILAHELKTLVAAARNHEELKLSHRASQERPRAAIRKSAPRRTRFTSYGRGGTVLLVVYLKSVS
jgi:hypothetical protein